MAFDTDNLAKAAFKKLFGKAHTGPPVGEGGTKDLPNESVASNVTVASTFVYGESIPLTAPGTSTTAIRVCITGQEGELDLTEDGSSNGNTYYVTVPAAHDLLSFTNPETGSNYLVGERVQNIIPASFGSTYRPIIKDNGTEVPPTDSSDWFLDDRAGTVTSETDLSLSTTGTIACYVYVGDMVSDVLTTNAAHIADSTIHFTEASIDHGSIAGLADDDHTQYLNETRHDALAADNPHSVTFTQAVAADGGTDISAAEAETLTDGSNADALHTHSGGSSITVEDEGTPLTTAVTLFDFAGAGVTVTEPVADQVLVTIPGGSGAGSSSDTELLFNNSSAIDGISTATFDGSEVTFSEKTNFTGTTHSAGYMINMSKSDYDLSGGTDQFALNIDVKSTTAGGDDLRSINLVNTVNNTGSFTGTQFAARYIGRISAAATVSNFNGCYTEIQHQSTGTLTNARALNAKVSTNTTGTITNAYAIEIEAATNPSGTITNNYGLYIPEQTAGTTNYSAILAGAAKLHFRETGTYIDSPSTNNMSLNATTKIDLNSTTVDISTLTVTTNTMTTQTTNGDVNILADGTGTLVLGADGTLVMGTSTLNEWVPDTDLKINLGASNKRLNELHALTIYRDFISIVWDEDSTASASEYNIIDDANYTGTFDHSELGTTRGLTITSADGDIEVANDGEYLIMCSLILNTSGSGTCDFRVTKNDSTTIWDGSWYIHSAVDPVSRVVSFVDTFVDGDTLQFHVDGSSSITVKAETTITVLQVT